MNRFLNLLLLLAMSFPGFAQQDTSATAKKAAADLEAQIHTDWARLKRYAKANAALPPPVLNEKRVVFMGNSITEGWLRIRPEFFKNKPYVNRGISAQTTPQMLVRFRADVIDLKPAVVIILAGINDIAENTGPSKIETIFGHIVSMAELAKASNISVVLSSVLPAYDFPLRPGLHPVEKVAQLNGLLKAYADNNNIVYADYYSAMVDERKGLRADLSIDAIHPNAEGYKIMEPIAEIAIAEALKRK